MHTNRWTFVLGLAASLYGLAFAPEARAQADILATVQSPAGSLPVRVLTPAESLIVASVDARAEEAVRFLAQAVDINSGTGNTAGVQTAGNLFRSVLDSLGFRTRWVALPDGMDGAGHLFAERTGSRGKRVLLIGHLDTVYELRDPFQRFSRQNLFARGPGVIDAKGGDVVLLYALLALRDAGALDGAGITVALSGDEEDPGTPYAASRAALMAAARASDVALAFEPAAENMGHATPVRLGFSDWALRIRAPAASGDTAAIPQAAVDVAAGLIRRFQMDQADEYLSIFPLGLSPASALAIGQDGAGPARSILRSGVVLEGGVRFASWEQLAQVRARMSELARGTQDVETELTFGADPYPGMPARPESFALLDMLSAISVALGGGPVDAGDPHRRGGGDISFVGHLIPGLDGLGPTGSGAHSPQETVDLESLTLATKRAALLIYRLTGG
jgi:glutamate carboxypeptidase